MDITGRTRTADGEWWFEAEAILPLRYQHADGRTEVTGAPTPISVPADRITRILGEDYSAVPTAGAATGRQWALERLHQYADGPSRCLHRRDCWQVRSEHTLIPTDEAAGLLGNPAVACCDVCRPDQAFRS